MLFLPSHDKWGWTYCNSNCGEEMFAPWPPGGDIRVSYNKVHSLDVCMEQCVQRPTKFSILFLKENLYLAYFSCIKSEKPL